MNTMKIEKVFRFYQKQKDWLARALLSDGGVIALEPGLGKTLFGLTWAWLKGSRRVLIVAPADLHLQWIQEARSKFGIEIHPVNSVAEAHALGITTPLTVRPAPEGEKQGPLPALPEFYITSYTSLGMNGGDEWTGNTKVRRTDENGEQYWLVTGKRKVVERREKDMAKITGRKLTPQEFANYSENIGMAKDPETGALRRNQPLDVGDIPCVHRATLGTLIGESFDGILCDEAVRLKNRDSLQAQGIFRIQAKHRLALTGTPIKNRLPDICMLNWYVTGGDNSGKNPRWPYTSDPKDITAFENEHMVQEENISAAQRARERGEGGTIVKRRNNDVCNVHRLWKALGPCVLRGRKADVADEIPPKTIHPVRCAMGRHQARVYGYHMSNPPQVTKDGKPHSPLSQIGAQLANLRQAAVDPSSPNLKPHHSQYDISFKMQALFDQTCDILEDGEQFVIMSPYKAFGQAFEARLLEAGVRCARLDGDVNPKSRSRYVAKFKRRELSVLICAQNSMSEGHSLECCSKLALVSIDWALDKNLQAIERVHRMTSPKPVDIYLFLTSGTIDEKVKQVFDEKADTSNLALDAQLFRDETEEVNMFDLLQGAKETWEKGVDQQHEEVLLRSWPKTRSRLSAAQHAFTSAQAGTAMLEELDPSHTPTPAAATLEDPNMEALWADLLGSPQGGGAQPAHPLAEVSPPKETPPAPPTDPLAALIMDTLSDDAAA